MAHWRILDIPSDHHGLCVTVSCTTRDDCDYFRYFNLKHVLVRKCLFKFKRVQVDVCRWRKRFGLLSFKTRKDRRFSHMRSWKYKTFFHKNWHNYHNSWFISCLMTWLIVAALTHWLCNSCAAEQPEATGSLGHRGEQVHVDSHLCSEDEQPAAVGPEQQQSEWPAAGHGQVTDDATTTCNLITLDVVLSLLCCQR